MRVVSLVPSSTETLLDLGADVVACTRFCEQPGLPHVGGTKNPDVAAIVELDPDLVVLDRQENRREDADALAAAGLDLFVSDVRTVTAAIDVIAELADRVHLPAPAPAVPDVDPGPELVVFVPIWRRPWMSINDDTYGASVLRHVGCRLTTASAVLHYPVVELGDVAAAEPDAVLVPSEPYDFTARHLDDLRRTIPGVAVERVDGRDLFWWGSRTPGALGRVGATIDRLRRSTRPDSEEPGAR